MLPSDDDEVILVMERRRPLILTACWRAATNRLFGMAAPPWVVNWSETAFEMLARFLWGLLIGAGLCVLLFPMVFWPNRRSRNPAYSSVYEKLGASPGVGWIFISAIAASCLYFVMSTRAVVRFLKADASSRSNEP